MNSTPQLVTSEKYSYSDLSVPPEDLRVFWPKENQTKVKQREKEIPFWPPGTILNHARWGAEESK